jgi:Ca-activated chloride channel family protein
MRRPAVARPLRAAPMAVPLAAALLIAAGAASAVAAEPGTWSDLWLRKDQQAQRALEEGQPAAAARLFEDPRRRGYAEIEARDYAAAARRLAPLADPESQYNRGNALARGGDLAAALGAYDAALKKAPPDSALMRDAKHNRDLVARQMAQQSQDKNGQSKGNAPQNGNGQSKSSQAQNSQQSSSGQQQSAQSPPEGGEETNDSQSASNNESPDGRNPNSGAGQPPPPPSASADARQAQNDAAAALSDAQRQANAAPTTTGRAGGNNPDRMPPGAAANGNADLPPPKPPTEQALALDQWLRWIPDDPSGLLRRKFLIEHMMKQRGSQP